MIQALIFDFDGLILDTEISSFQSWQAIYQEYQCELPLQKWAACVGGGVELFDPCDYLELLLGAPVAREALTVRRRLLHLEMIGSLGALPGVEDYLLTAKQLGLRLGVASSSPRAWVEGHLSRLKLLNYFDHLCCGDEVTHKKPHPELYLSVLAALGVSADEAFALEDSPNGVRAAQRAGMFCVAVPNIITSQLSLVHADMRLASLADISLTALIAEVERRRVIERQEDRSSITVRSDEVMQASAITPGIEE
jgi:HAD superfamily hydrolase (TIGR01509 family)